MERVNNIKCPRCNHDLHKTFYKDKIIYKCNNCQGRTMTLAALRGICENRNFTNMLWEMARFGKTKNGVICPSCNRQMNKIQLPFEDINFEVDICCDCQNIWFDQNELEQIPIKQEKKDVMPKKAKEILAMHQISVENEKQESNFYTDSPNSPLLYIAGILGFPIEDENIVCEKFPILNYAVIVICTLIFILSYSNLKENIYEWGFISNYWNRHHGLTIITSQFMHAGIFHLIGNMYFLFVFGDNIEEFLGKWKYTLLIISSGIMALILHMALDSRSSLPVVGASGFISGIIAFYGIIFPNYRIKFRWRQRFIYNLEDGWFSLPAWFLLFFWFLMQIILSRYITKHSSGGTAFFAHIGGAMTGLIWGICYYASKYLKFKNS